MGNRRRNALKENVDTKFYEKQMDDLTNENKNVKLKLAECIEELKNVAKEKIEYEEEIERLKKNATPNVEKLRKQKEILENENRRIEEKNKELSMENQKFKDSLKEYEEKEVLFIKQERVMETTYKEVEEIQQQLIKEKHIQATEISNLKAKNKILQEQIAQNNKTNIVVENSTTLLQRKDIEEKINIINQQRDSIEKLEQTVIEKEKELASLVNINQELETNKKGIEAEVKNMPQQKETMNYQKNDIANILLETQKMAKEMMAKAKREVNLVKHQNEKERILINKDINAITMKANLIKDEADLLYSRALSSLEKIINDNKEEK